MKNYYFNPHNYSETYVVLAESEQTALQELQIYLKTKMGNDSEFGRLYYSKWMTATIDNLPEGYTIDVYEAGQVIEGEIS